MEAHKPVSGCMNFFQTIQAIISPRCWRCSEANSSLVEHACGLQLQCNISRGSLPGLCPRSSRQISIVEESASLLTSSQRDLITCPVHSLFVHHQKNFGQRSCRRSTSGSRMSRPREESPHMRIRPMWLFTWIPVQPFVVVNLIPCEKKIASSSSGIHDRGHTIAQWGWKSNCLLWNCLKDTLAYPRFLNLPLKVRSSPSDAYWELTLKFGTSVSTYADIYFWLFWTY